MDANGRASVTLRGSDGLTVGQEYRLRLYLPGPETAGSFDVCINGPTCSNPAFTTSLDYTSCPGGSPSVDVTVNSLGDAGTLLLTNNGGAPSVSITSPGTYSVGPFNSGSPVTLALTYDRDAACTFEVGTFDLTCPAENNRCENAQPVTVNTLGTDTETFEVVTVDATDEDIRVYFSCSFEGANYSLWYSFLATDPSVVINILDNPVGRLLVNAYTDDCASGNNYVTCGEGRSGSITLSGFTAGQRYLLRVQPLSGSVEDVATLSLQAESALPATLLTFTGEAASKTNQITWTTATETGVADFTLERSSAPSARDWRVVGTVRARNTAGLQQVYQLEDAQPIPESYYRLVTQDLDGSQAVSSVISVIRPGGADLTGTQIFPNPTTGQAYVRYTTEAAELDVRVLTATGQVLQQYQVPGGAGTLTLPLRDVPAGVYFIHLNDGVHSHTRRVVRR